MIDPQSVLLAAVLALVIVAGTWIAMICRLTGWWRLFRVSRRQRREGEA